jgi:hypothetical protein
MSIVGGGAASSTEIDSSPPLTPSPEKSNAWM